MTIAAQGDTFSYDDGTPVRQTAQMVAVANGLSSASPSYVKAANYTPRSPDQQITIATLQSATALTPATSATVAFVQNNTTQAIRWRDTGSNPTVSVGQRIAAGDTLTYDGSLSAIKFIAEAAGTGTLDVAYYS